MTQADAYRYAIAAKATIQGAQRARDPERRARALASAAADLEKLIGFLEPNVETLR